MKDLGRLHHFLGMEVVQDETRGAVWFGQKAYTEAVLLKYGMENSKAVSTPSEPGCKLVKLCKEKEEETVDQKLYQAAVGGLLYIYRRRPGQTLPTRWAMRQDSVLSRAARTGKR